MPFRAARGWERRLRRDDAAKEAVGEACARPARLRKVHAVHEPPTVGVLAHVPGILQDGRRKVVGRCNCVGAVGGRADGNLRGRRCCGEQNDVKSQA